MISADLSGRRIIVTGGASGIGLAAVEIMAKMGAKVALNYLPNDETGSMRVAEFNAAGLEVIGAPGNVGIAGEAEAMIDAAITQLDGLDYLINNAGTPGTPEPIAPANLDAMTEEFWQMLLNVNLIGPFRCAHAAADALKQSKGSIVNTASIAGVGKQGSSIAYSATKTGLVSLTRSLARALAPEVRVNAVAPGQVKTPWTENWPEERKQLARDQSVLNRRCSPEEIAFGMLYLCAGNTMVTGHTLVIDGGMTL